ncbi:structural protein [Synechococcus phage S-SM1]|uniref:YadA domain-containing structural protein n=1 Tax=Synechococcus phage S-SM1 TaxID=444859 RepID=E3SIB6_9CAUD|nr:structural protein [Synechococcus phage S-SM1]ADO97241.1 YadA domain-containing structural protein [Synechococcus phage S-SM1]
MANRIQLRRGGAQEWANSNPTLAQGELGIELDTGRFKIGDGVTAWNTLRYERPVESVTNTANTLVQRDADGNFAAGTVTATLIGNASTAARLASARQIQLAQDITASGVFDGSANLTLNAELGLISTLPHYDGTNTATGTYTKVVVDAKGRITNASFPSTLADYNLNGTVEGQSAQPYDLDLVAIAGLTTTGIIARTSGGAVSTRTITGTAGRIAINNGNGVSGNPTIDLITTTISAGDYNTESLTSVAGSQTVNATKFSVDAYGRFTSAATVPIATAVEGTTALAYDAGTAYSRYAIITNASKVYQALESISAGAGAPTHSSGDTGGWRYLAAEGTEQKGLASFAQEDFDVSAAGHVTIAAAGVDNTQLQNNKIIFTDGNTVENFELDNELTTATGNTGFNYLNFVKVNDTSGNLLFGANNTGDSGAGEIDVNVRSYFSDPDITLDGAASQTLDKSGDGNLTFSLTQNSASARNLSITSTNAGSGTSTVTISAEDVVDIDASAATGKVHIEDLRIQDNYLASTGQLNLDPGDDRAATGLVRIFGNLQIDGTTTTVNSTELSVDDVTILLGGDTAPGSDDNLDRGVEFRYYDTQARLGFYGWDTNYTDLAGHEGGYTFLHAATNSSEVFTGTASGITAGNLKLTTGTASSSNTTGDLVVAGGAGITGAVNIGGNTDIDGTFRANSTSRFDDNIVLQGASKTLQLNNGSGTTKIELQSTTGNASFGGVVDVTGNFNVNTDKFNVVAASGNTSVDGTLTVAGNSEFNGTVDVDANFAVRSGTTDKFTVASSSGNTVIEGTLNGKGAADFDSTLNVDGNTTLGGTVTVTGNSEFNGTVDVDANFAVRSGTTDKFTVASASGNTVISGTLGVTGATTLTGALDLNNAADISGLVHLESTDVPNILSGAPHTIQNNDYGALRVDGGGYFANDVLFNGDLYLNGEFLQQDDATENFGTRNYLAVRYKIRAGTSAAYTPNYSTHGQSNLRVYGGAGIRTTLHIGGTDSGEGLFVGKETSSDTVKFSVLGATGNTSTEGTLNVEGEVTIQDSVIINAANEIFSIRNGSAVEKFGVDTDNGNTNIIGTLTVGDATQINDTFGVSGVTTLTANSQQTLTGSYAADGAFRLTGGAGIGKNLAVSGDARIYGATELTGALDLNNSADISGALVTHDNVTITADNKEFAIQNGSAVDKFTVDTDNGNTDIRGTLDVGGDVTAESNLTVTGNLTVNGTTTTVNSTVTTLDDPIITVGGDTAPSSSDGKDRGVEFRYYDGSAKIGFFGFDRSAQQFAFLTSATNNSEVLTGTDGALRAGSLNLTGSGTGLDVDNNANIDGTLTVDGQFTSNVADGVAPFVITSTTKVNNLNVDRLDNMTTASANTASTVVNRDSSGNFAAGTITAALTGNASTATTLETARTITVDGVVDGSVSFNGSADVTISTTFNDADITALAAMTGTGFVTRTADNTYARRSVTATASSGITITNGDGVSGDMVINVASASTNASNNLVIRDASGNFAAGTITAALTGNVTGQVSDISNHDTDALTEGSTNLYYTDERVDDRVNALIVAGTGITKAYNDAAGTYTLTVTQADIDTDNVTEGSTNLFTTAARTRTHFTYGTGIELSGAGALSVTQADINTDNITEGSTNVFYTNARFDTQLATKDTGDLAEGTNLYYTDARADARIAAADTDDLSEGSANLYYTDARADARVAAATGANLDLSSKSTSDLSEGTNQYYTEARVQAKLDNAFAQLQAMLNNLATTTTLTLNLSGDPTPGAVVTTGVSNGGGGGFTAGTAVATSGGTGSGLTVDTTVVGGVITAAAVNAGGSDYLITDTVTITNPNAGKVLTLNLASLAGGSNYVTGTALATTGGSGSASLTVDITAVAGAITNVTINDGGTGYVAGETITIVQATGADGSNPGTGGTIDISTVATNATLTLTDITTMEVGATVTGATSGTTGVITALGTNQITVDNVDGFFKSGEVVSANDVTTLTISSFS